MDSVEFGIFGISIPVPILVIYLANLMPLIGVLFFDWNAKTILLIYWAESAIIGFFTIIKMLRASASILLKIILVPFFCIHFGGFMLGHLIALITILVLYLPGDFSFMNFFIGILVLFLGRSIVFAHGPAKESDLLDASLEPTNPENTYLIKAGYPNLTKAMFEPYPRIIVMQLTIIFGVFGIQFFGNYLPNMVMPKISAILLISLKCVLEYFIQLKSAKKN